MMGDEQARENRSQEPAGEEENDLNIASRTRSHLRIDNFVPTDNLDFPDVEPNLYQDPDSEVDTEYKKFLNQCYSEEFGGDTNTDDNDPEYVYNDDIFSHGWRFDLDEVVELIEDESNTTTTTTNLAPIVGSSQCENRPQTTQEVTNHEHIIYIKQEQQPHLDGQENIRLQAPATPIKSPIKSLGRKIDFFDDPEFARILNQQLRQHIQLLSQTFILAKHSTNMRREAEEAKSYLDSYMKIFKHKNKPVNLLPALDLVNNLITPKELKSSIRLSWRPIPLPLPVDRIVRHNPRVFMYPSLLPKVAFSFLPEKLIPKKPKINFTENEDKLLAYALNEFKGESSQYAFIASLLMPAKTKTQISNHIKNIKRSSGCESNPIKLFYSTGQLPEIDLTSETNLTDPNVIVQEEEPPPDDEKFKTEQHELDSSAEMKNEMNPPVTSEHLPVQTSESDINQTSVDLLESREETVTISEPVSVIQQLSSPFSNRDGGYCLPPSEVEEKVEELQEDQEDITPVELVTTIEPKSDEIDALSHHHHHQDIMNMNLDDLIAASTTISKTTMLNSNSGEGIHNKNLKNLKLKKSMLNLMSHNFLLSESMGDLIIHDFLKSAAQKLSETDNISLLRLLAKLSESSKDDDDDRIVTIYQEISAFLASIKAPPDLSERTVLFLNLEQATKSGCALSYLHWMKFFEFMQHVELYHDRLDIFEKKLVRLLDALQKEDTHKVKLAIANLIDKHPFLKRQFDLLSLEEKPHPSLFIWEEDFDDITEPFNLFSAQQKDEETLVTYEHFYSKVSEEEMRYASQTCPCKCHSSCEKFSVHCDKCNLKFVKGRMYLVNKIKPILAEWSYTGKQRSSPPKERPTTVITSSSSGTIATNPIVGWSLEEDREILEFCRMKAEQSGEAISFDTSIFEELVNKRRSEPGGTEAIGEHTSKRSPREIAQRFDQLMDLYRDEHPNSSSNQSQQSSSIELSKRPTSDGDTQTTNNPMKEDALMRDCLAHHQ